MKMILTTVVLCVAIAACGQTAQPGSQFLAANEHMKWISEMLRSIQTIKVGSTRADLLKLFQPEGGFFTSQRSYVYRECPYVKVDVQFTQSSSGKELPSDKITEISHPYLAWPIVD